MDKVEYTERELLLIDPKPGTAAARARDFGIDLSITVSNLRLTPEERIRQLDNFQSDLKLLRHAFKRSLNHARARSRSEADR